MSGEDLGARIDRALGDAGLHVAIDRAVEALRERRDGALSGLPDADGVRDAARAARSRGLRRLDELLIAFETQARARGIRVHFAATAEEAVAQVAAIAQAAGCTRAVKSKSMATEEVHLNAGLAARGVAARETDLGEYIVQLADDRPSHIILPIVHLTRGDVGDVVHRELGEPRTDVPEELAAIARRRLREDFLQADLGITGANLAVADAGALWLVSNEGNIRLTTTLPRVHVALVGIDKLVATEADATGILQVLARSATGQASTVYTTMIQGPTSGDEEGPDEVHVVFLDHGRTRILGGPQADVLGCVRCGACLNSCPVYRQIGGHAYGTTYPGPIGAVFEAARSTEHAELPSLCTLCGACEDACPVRLPLPRMLLDLRGAKVDRGQVSPARRAALRLWAWAMTSPRWAALARRIGRALVRPRGGWLRWGPGPLGAWTRHRDLPVPRASFWDGWQGSWSEEGSAGAVARRTREVAEAGPVESGRDALLGRIRESLATAPPPSFAGRVGSTSPPAPGVPDPLEEFACRARALSAEVCVEETAGAVEARVAELLQGHTVASWSELPYGLEPPASSPPAEASAGLTGADGAVASTGALLLIAGPGHERTPSMLPPLHVAILRRGDIHPDLPAALAATGDARDAASAVHLIAGPSRTADIELTLTLGVHGPGRLAIVIGP